MANNPRTTPASHRTFPTLQTLRLDLVPITPESLRSQIGFGSNMRADLGAILNAHVPIQWPHENWEPHVLDYLLGLIAEKPEAAAWCRYLILREPDTSRTLIGSFGSGFPNPETGEAEIGYGILPAWQRQGYAPEAVTAMLPWLEEQVPIRAFVAQTFPHLRGSIRVLEKCNFEPAGKGYEGGTILFRRRCTPNRKPDELSMP